MKREEIEVGGLYLVEPHKGDRVLVNVVEVNESPLRYLTREPGGKCREFTFTNGRSFICRAKFTVQSSVEATKPSWKDSLKKPKDNSPHVIVEARAGTGKTTTLVEGLKIMRGETSKLSPSPQQAAVWKAIAQSAGVSRVGFCAFNKSIAAELKSRVPAGCDAMTMHGMGFKAINGTFSGVVVDEYRVRMILADILGMDLQKLKFQRFDLLMAVEKLVGLCKMNLVDAGGYWKAGMGAELEEALDNLTSYYEIELNGNRHQVYEAVPAVLEKCKQVNLDRKIDYDDMIWLPVVLDLSMHAYDLLLVDEAQDLNRCQQALARKAGNRLILCGDPCQPPGTMVTLAGAPGNRWHKAVPGNSIPIEEVKKGDTLVGYCPKDGSNYSNRIVEGVSVTQFDGELITVETEDGVKSSYTPQHHCYASFGSLRDCYCVYLMKRGLQFRVGSCQLNYRSSGNGLVHRLRTEGGDAAWLLETHPSKREARLREMEVSHRYNLPQVVFSNGNEGYILDDEGVVRFWEFVGNNASAGLKVIDAFKLEWNRPIAVPGGQWQQSFKRPSIFAAANLRDGMELRTEDGRWVRIRVERTPYKGPVYSLSVSHDKLYMADGIVTHNCQAIYGFAGADAESIPRLERELGATSRECIHLPLTVTRRCGKAIVAEAQQYVPDFEAHESNGPGRILQERLGTYRRQVEDGDMILCRCNAPLVSECFKFLRDGRKATIQGRDIGQGLISTVKKLKASSIPDLLTKLSAWEEHQVKLENAKKNPSDSRIQGIQDRVDCITCFAEESQTVDALIEKIEKIFTDQKTQGVKLSSVHRAKGLEAVRVFLLLLKDAPMPHPMAKTAWAREQERNLVYVAITRAIEELVYVQD